MAKQDAERGECRACGRTIGWIRARKICPDCGGAGCDRCDIAGTVAGEMMPLEPRVITVVTEAGDVVKGREAHFAHCPNYRR